MTSGSEEFYKRGEMGRSVLEAALSLPSRAMNRSRAEDMTTEEKDFAHFSNEIYKKPDDRDTTLRGYTLLQTEIPKHEGSVSLNDERWAVYRAPNGIDHILVFRGTANWEDVGHDLELQGGFGEHKYMMDAAVWSSRVMLFLNAEFSRNVEGGDEAHLRFRVTGHSLGGAVAMGVILYLHDIPNVAKQLEGDGFERERSPDFTVFKQEIADPWNAEFSRKGSEPPYELCGGHVFNPGAWPRDFPRDYATLMAVGSDVLVGNYGSLMHVYDQHYDVINSGNRVEKGVTTHHVIGDLISCCYRMGKEKTYPPKDTMAFLMSWWPGKKDKARGPHSMLNFL